MKFDHPDHKDYSFELPDKWSVRLVLDYDSEIELVMIKNGSKVRLSAANLYNTWPEDVSNVQKIIKANAQGLVFIIIKKSILY